MSLKNAFIIKEAFGDVTPEKMKGIAQQHAKEVEGSGKTVFLVTFGDGRPNGSTEKIIGIFSTHEAALNAGSQANHEAGISGDAEGESYGAQVDEVELDKLLNYPT